MCIYLSNIFFSVTVEGQYFGYHCHLFTVPADVLQSFDSEFIGLPKIEGNKLKNGYRVQRMNAL